MAQKKNIPLKYYLFLDETGDQSLANFNPSFPIFSLCGIIMSHKNYMKFCAEINKIKNKYWEEQKIIFHSRDIRKHQKGFEILFDLDIKKKFYKDINNLIATSNYNIISSSILKENYIKKYGKSHNVYGVALSFIIERTVFLLDSINKRTNRNLHLEVIVEKRGKKEDKRLLSYYNELLDVGTYYVSPQRIKGYFKHFHFKWKRENINGLQLADLVAYPIARHVLDPKLVNKSYDILKEKLYKKGDRIYGLKIFP